ncbi:MAG: hypothetical protein HOE90_08325 [Bacteriovoracaceae bacterium]|nr:hypothetical protein [Bacteriovoracaceae bacterium]
MKLVLEAFKFYLSLINPFLMKKVLFKWNGKKPSTLMSYKLFRDLKKRDISQLSLLSFEAIKKIQSKSTKLENQLIEKNGIYEHSLLKKSFLKFFPHEVAKIRVVSDQGEDISSRFYHCSQYRALDLMILRKQVSRLYFLARKKGLNIKEIEISHTHPSLEVLIVDQCGFNFITNGLSAGDQNIGSIIARDISHPLRVKAITPLANYSMVF